jgi:hypothetical protein
MLAVLVNEHTAGASEILAGAIKDSCRACPVAPAVHTYIPTCLTLRFVPCVCVFFGGGSMLRGHFRQTTMALPTRVELGEPHTSVVCTTYTGLTKYVCVCSAGE